LNSRSVAVSAADPEDPAIALKCCFAYKGRERNDQFGPKTLGSTGEIISACRFRGTKGTPECKRTGHDHRTGQSNVVT